MGTLVQRLAKRGLISPPDYVVKQTQYEVMMGSIAYGVSGDESDIDIYGFCIPDKNVVFPHLGGEILGFGRQKKRFEQYQQHHIDDPSNKKEYDITIYNIVKYFDLCLNNNPNMIDSLFVPQRCILHSTQVGNLVREHRKMFLHKGSWHKYKGYAFSQLHKMRIKNPEGKRKEMIEKYGYDLKFAYHIVRLLNQVEQILIEHDLDLERNREQLKSIRRGEWPLEQIEKYFEDKERSLEDVYIKSDLKHSPDEPSVKELLFNCLEMHFGSLDKAVVKEDRFDILINDIKEVLNKHG